MRKKPLWKFSAALIDSSDARCFQQVTASRALCKSASSQKPQQPPSNTIFVGGIPVQTTQDELTAHFAQYGHITKINFPRDTSPAYRNRGFCFIAFSSVAEAAKAVSVGPGNVIRGRRVRSTA